jgi:hypothetical protein
MFLYLLPLLLLAGTAAAQNDEATLTVVNGSFVITTPGGTGTLFIDGLNVVEVIELLVVCRQFLVGPFRSS